MEYKFSETPINPKGYIYCACEIVEHSIFQFHKASKYYTKEKLDEDYLRRHTFLNEGKLLKLLSDVMERDYPRFKKSLIEKLNHEYQIASKRYVLH
jgi:hypothetical protein